ncbi:MAG: hypothetical protein AAF318_09515 [Pseudomonadota bacterium]
MNAALLVSAIVHLMILVALIVRLESPDALETAAVAALPVEIVTVAEETDLTVGDERAEEVVETPAEETVETEAAADESPGATERPSDEIAQTETARDTAESTAPEPEGAPEPQEATPSESETEVAALQPEEAAPEEPVSEPAEAAETFVPSSVVPNRKPTPPPRREAAREARSEEAFNADRLSQLINRTDGQGGNLGAAQASLGSRDGRANAELTLSEKDSLRQQMQACWNPPVGVANGAPLVVAVQIRLALDGSVVNIDRVDDNPGRLFEVAADAARRAVLQCQPYTLPPQKYASWKDVQVTFDPRQLF